MTEFIPIRLVAIEVQGGNSMHAFIAAFQQRLPAIPPPIYAETTTVWHHMSVALDQSLYRVLGLLMAVLPGLLAFVVALLVFTLIGMAVSAVLRHALVWIRFDDRLTRNRTDWTPSSSPTGLVARGSFWVCVALGFLIGISAFDASYATAATPSVLLLPYFTHFVGAIIVLLFGTIIARFLARSVLISAVNAQLQYARFLSLGVKWLVLVLTAAMVLDHLEIGGRIVELAFGILFGGIVLTLAIAIGLGSRDLVSRSIETQLERSSERAASSPAPTETSEGESLRHF
jgi:hypothetical protein